MAKALRPRPILVLSGTSPLFGAKLKSLNVDDLETVKFALEFYIYGFELF